MLRRLALRTMIAASLVTTACGGDAERMVEDRVYDLYGRPAEAAICLKVPTISRFYGIVIAMYFGDHPPPHIHARYGGHKGRIAIRTGEPLDGDLPPRALRLIREWCDLRRSELDTNWARAEAESPLVPVEPLP